jgi:3-hydroxyisobutyrate dehydrogenase
MRTGFIGLGAMGAPMARHLAAHSQLAGVYNRTHSTAQRLADELKVPAFQDPAELAAHCDVVLLCVSADADVLSVARASYSALQVGSVVIDTSTVSSGTACTLAHELKTFGAHFLDAPLSGGVEGARNGKLSVMVGGDAAVLNVVRPVLQCFAARITHMGPVGSGQATKAVNQVLIAGIAEAVCEGLAFGEKLGLPHAQLLDVLKAGAAQSWFLEKRGATMLDDEFGGGFKLALLLKDLKIVQAMQAEQGMQSSVVAQAIADYSALVDMGAGDDEISSLIRLKRPAAA